MSYKGKTKGKLYLQTNIYIIFYIIIYMHLTWVYLGKHASARAEQELLSVSFSLLVSDLMTKYTLSITCRL